MTTHCNTLQHTATNCLTWHGILLQCVATALCQMTTHCNTLQHTATNYLTWHGILLQCVATALCQMMCCSVFQCVPVYVKLLLVLQCVAVTCSVMQCGAVCCSVLQCAAVCCSVLQSISNDYGAEFCEYLPVSARVRAWPASEVAPVDAGGSVHARRLSASERVCCAPARVRAGGEAFALPLLTRRHSQKSAHNNTMQSAASCCTTLQIILHHTVRVRFPREDILKRHLCSRHLTYRVA